MKPEISPAPLICSFDSLKPTTMNKTTFFFGQSVFGQLIFIKKTIGCFSPKSTLTTIYQYLTI